MMIPLPTTRRAQAACDSPDHPDYLPGVFIVKVKRDLVASFPDLGTATVATLKSLRLPDAVEEPFRDLRRRRLIQAIVPVFAETPVRGAMAVAAGMTGIARTAGGAKELDVTSGMRASTLAFARSVRDVEDEDLRGINLVRVSSKTELGPILKELKSSRGIEYCEPVPARWVATSTPVPGSVNPMLNRQWGLRAIHWFDTGCSLDASPVKVAVLDTGVDEAHPDLGPSVIANYDHDGLNAEDIVGHGTHVCGIIAANPGKRVGVTGISNCKIHVWKIFSDVPASNGEYYVDEVPYLRALRAAQTSGMQIINLSIAGRKSSTTEKMLFQKLIGAGVITVAAMGNDFERGNPTEFPAAYDDVLAVGATDEVDRRALFSNTGSHIAISAPGANILSTLPISTSSYRKTGDVTNYAVWSGTSMAAPHITAAASLVMVAKPGLSPKQVIERLKSTASGVPEMGGKKRTNELGSGLLDLKAAVN